MDQYIYDELMSLLESAQRLAGDNDDLNSALDDARDAVRAEWREAQRGLRGGPVVYDECLTDLLEREREGTETK